MEKLMAQERQRNSTYSPNKIRRSGKVPGILYGKNLKNLMFEVGELELNEEVHKIGEHGVFNVDINGQNHNVLIKEIQREPVNHKIVHIDLEQLSENSRVTTEVPIRFLGESMVSKNGGIVQKEKNSVKLQCRAEKIPKYINVDVSNLAIGDSYRVADIEFGEEISIIDGLSSVILTVTDINNRKQNLEEIEEE